MIKCLFLIETGLKVGLGHLKRCQVLARAMMDAGWSCRLGLSDPSLIDAPVTAGFDAAAWVADGLDLGPVDVLVVDGYTFDPHLVNRWRGRTGLSLVLDDMAERPVPADVVLNHNLFGADLDYGAYGCRRVLGGPDYALVDPRFLSTGKAGGDRECGILVSFGAADDGRYCVPMTERLLTASPDIRVDMVLAPVHRQSPEIAALQDRHHGRLTVHHGADMPDLMARNAVLSGAAGLTVLEALASGMTPVVCRTVDNQRFNIPALRALGFPAFDDFELPAMADAAITASKAESARPAIRLDGQGPRRIMTALENLVPARAAAQDSVG